MSWSSSYTTFLRTVFDPNYLGTTASSTTTIGTFGSARTYTFSRKKPSYYIVPDKMNAAGRYAVNEGLAPDVFFVVYEDGSVEIGFFR